ncbi:MAG: hypothetical protein QM674_14825 [Burkholderiaceae bacterium]
MAELGCGKQISSIEHQISVHVVGNNTIWLIKSGNFLDGSIVGPLIALVQAEIVASVVTLMRINSEEGVLLKNDKPTRDSVASLWLNHFLDCKNGILSSRV